ncbi:TetR family transcriptional regulator [Glutamicibacter sp.]|uniref:TetR/AcrR family transcriptional regulator n=1 Tax=Glutamicibacter sp. TaxID=1931995 RepID=UPI0028BDBB11|nr:TetR family transcriptional regulator [Glutamicibacter sp.]
MADYSKFAPQPTLRSRQKAATRQLLIDAAAQVFAANGYAKSRIDDVAAAAGTSRATFYLHFGGKTELLSELIVRAQESFAADFRELAVLFGDPQVDELRRWIQRALSHWSGAATLMRPVFEATDNDPLLASRLLPEALPGSAPLAAALCESRVCADAASAQGTALVFMAPLFVAFRRRAMGSAVDEEQLAQLTAISWAAVARELAAG